MKFFDRLPQSPNMRKITQYEKNGESYTEIEGSEKYVKIEYADNPTTQGTALSASNFNKITSDIITSINDSEMVIKRDTDGNIIYDEKRYFTRSDSDGTTDIITISSTDDASKVYSTKKYTIQSPAYDVDYLNVVIGFSNSYNSTWRNNNTDPGWYNTKLIAVINNTEFILAESDNTGVVGGVPSGIGASAKMHIPKNTKVEVYGKITIGSLPNAGHAYLTNSYVSWRNESKQLLTIN